MHWRAFVAALSLTAVQGLPVVAATAEERAAARQAVEKQVREVDGELARQQAARAPDAPETPEQELARRWNAAARELLKLGNTRAAGVLAGHARRVLAPPSPARAVQP
jgi:hypothetical protein